MVNNFSRFILNWKVSLELSAQTCLENIREAYNKYLPANPENTETMLLCDGRSENNNTLVEEYMEQVPLKKVIANEIGISNSMVEAVNKNIKYRYLFQDNIPDFPALVKYLEKAVQDYNYHKPHWAHKGLTPAEALDGVILNTEELKEQVKAACRARIEYNKQQNCENFIIL